MKTQIGNVVTGNLKKNLLTLEIEGEMVLEAGKFAVVPIDEYNKLIDSPKKIDCSSCVFWAVSKHVEPCYGCRDNEEYLNYKSSVPSS
jgi:hypothetical protein